MKKDYYVTLTGGARGLPAPRMTIEICRNYRFFVNNNINVVIASHNPI